MYDGPVIDAFLHTPWMGAEDPSEPRGDRVDWSGDRRLQRVMHTFRHDSDDGKPAAAIDASALRREMDQAGVARVVLPAKIYYRASERSVIAVHRQLERMCTGAGDDSMKWACSLVPPESGPGTYWDFMENPRLIAAESMRPGIAGVHITPSPWATPPNHKWYYPAYAACVERRLPLLAYVGAPGPLWPMDPNDPSHLDEVALAFPDLVIIAHHIGDPWVEIAIRLAARHPNFYICTSAWSPKAYPKALLAFLKGGWHGARGCDNVVFASDYPLLDMQRVVRDLRQLELSEQQLRRVAHDNALELFWQPPQRGSAHGQ